MTSCGRGSLLILDYPKQQTWKTIKNYKMTGLNVPNYGPYFRFVYYSFTFLSFSY